MSVLKVMATPLSGDYSQLPAFAAEEAAKADLIIGEERKNVLRFLAALNIRDKEYRLLNEHSEGEDVKLLLSDIKAVDTAVLFSDAGSPCVADPGHELVDMCINAGVEIISIPGPSSITAALSVSGFFAESFLFAGFPPKDKTERSKFYNHMKNTKQTAVIFERPYALHRTLSELKQCGKRISLSVNLSMPDEFNIRGTAEEVLNKLPEKLKAPFVIVMDGKK
jgi:16S rRNA (cytidine1402-2'-O)-methyltransferase